MSADPLTADERLALEHMELRLLLELERDQDLDKAVKSFANLFQEIGQAYENKTVSTLYTRRMFNFLAGHYWDLLQFWIETYRERNDATLYSRFEFLAKTLREVAAIDEPSGGSASPKGPRKNKSRICGAILTHDAPFGVLLGFIPIGENLCCTRISSPQALRTSECDSC